MGRTTMSGPMAGAYDVLTLALDRTMTPGAVTSIWRIPIPYACRVMEVAVACQSSSGGASRPTFQITDGTNNLLSGAATVVTANKVVVSPTSSPSLVAAQRTRAKGDILQFQLTTVASEAVVGAVVSIAVAVRGHVVAAEADD